MNGEHYADSTADRAIQKAKATAKELKQRIDLTVYFSRIVAKAHKLRIKTICLTDEKGRDHWR